MSDQQKIILLVEDEPLLANLLKQRLEKEGYVVIHAGDGEAALSALKSTHPDLILLDIILPKMSGFEFMEQLKNNPAYGSSPVVIISNLGQESDVEKGKVLGAIGYFVKAKLSIEELVKKIKTFLAG
ncbi:MAG TPA: response regulator [Candidatus Paceibacterota bacterium]|nr:response regulator [Candidatus Paceibacterota bacterium]